MEDIGKLKKLIEHWSEHNIEHAETYEEWAIKAKEMGREDLYKILNDIASKTRGIEELYEKAKKVIR